MTSVTLDGLTKVYSDSRGSETAVDDVSLTIEDGEFIVIVGPSGCGKSTTLRMIAGLEPVTEGRIFFDETEVQELTPSVRDVAMVFQNYALYPSMTARKNIGYGLKHSMGLSKSEREARVSEAAEMLGITDVLDHKPDELSGGQKQRVALGRAIVREPSVFLLDEPLSNLDAKLRSQMRHEIQRIHQNLGITTVYVTHDQKEAMTMADRVVILNDGAIQQVDTPEKLYDQPNNKFVAQFIGSPSMNLLDVRVETDGTTQVHHRDSLLCSIDSETVSYLPSSVVAGIRPEHIELFEEPGDGRVSVDVVVSEYQGKTNFIHVDRNGTQLTARTKPEIFPESGSSIFLSVDPSNLYLFDAETGETVKHRQANQHATVKSASE